MDSLSISSEYQAKSGDLARLLRGVVHQLEHLATLG